MPRMGRMQIFPDVDGYIYIQTLPTQIYQGRMQSHQIRDTGQRRYALPLVQLAAQRLSIAVKFGSEAFLCVKVLKYELLIGHQDIRTRSIRVAHSPVCPRSFQGSMGDQSHNSRLTAYFPDGSAAYQPGVNIRLQLTCIIWAASFIPNCVGSRTKKQDGYKLMCFTLISGSYNTTLLTANTPNNLKFQVLAVNQTTKIPHRNLLCQSICLSPLISRGVTG